MQQEPQFLPIPRHIINKTRHKAETPLYVICVIIGIIAAIMAFDYLILEDNISEGTEQAQQSEGTAVAAAADGESDGEPDEDGGYGDFMWLVFLSPFIILFSMYFWLAVTRAYAIRVTEKNFPEIYHKSVEYSKRLGLRKVPAVYIEQQNGVINAFAAAVIGKRYAGLNAELVDVAYMEHKDFEPVYFVLAHEFGHIYYKHVTFWHNLLVYVAHLIPVIGSMHSRSREYSCDRIAQLLTGYDGAEEFMVITAGRHLYKYVDVQDYLETCKKERGIGVWFVNLFASHPITPKRIAALADPKRKSGRLLW